MYSKQHQNETHNQRPFLSKQQSSKLQWQKMKSNETVMDSRRDRRTTLQEIANCNNDKKLFKLCSQFMQSPEQITLDKQEIVGLFLKIHSYRQPQLVSFLHLLYDSNWIHRPVPKFIHIKTFLIQGQSGQLTRILEILAEMQTLNPDFQAFELEFQNIEEITNSFGRVQLRVLFLVSFINILRALRGSFYYLSNWKFLFFPSLKIIKLQILVIQQHWLLHTYILFSEQLDISNKLGFARRAVEIIGKTLCLKCHQTFTKIFSAIILRIIDRFEQILQPRLQSYIIITYQLIGKLSIQFSNQIIGYDLALNEAQYKVQEVRELKNEIEKFRQTLQLQDEKLTKYDVQYQIDSKEKQKLLHEIELLDQENRRIQHLVYYQDREIDYIRQQQEQDILHVEKKVDSLVDELHAARKETNDLKGQCTDLKRQLQQHEEQGNQAKAKYLKSKQQKILKMNRDFWKKRQSCQKMKNYLVKEKH